MKDIDKLKKKLLKIEKELDRVRTSSFIDGWQTKKHANKSRKWDELAKDKFKIKQAIELLENCDRELHNDDIFNHGICLKCNNNKEKIYEN
jgi:predicted RNase H-like nuclease (RuvC/YqgF family)